MREGGVLFRLSQKLDLWPMKRRGDRPHYCAVHKKHLKERFLSSLRYFDKFLKKFPLTVRNKSTAASRGFCLPRTAATCCYPERAVAISSCVSVSTTRCPARNLSHPRLRREPPTSSSTDLKTSKHELFFPLWRSKQTNSAQ